MYKRNCEIRSGVEFPEGMHRICLGVEYNGASFSGFQKQATATKTVQAYLERALSKIANEPISVVCAGRTDAGVHAWEQVVHFDTLANRPAKAWIHGVNSELPDDIRVHWSEPVKNTFHARFSATARTYRYVLYSANTRPACLNKALTWTSYSLDVEKMQCAAELLEGEHNFTSFRAAQCQAQSPVRYVHYVRFFRVGAFIVMEIKANAFLHHMVRNIVGCMIEVGRGAKSETWVRDLLIARDRSLAAATARPWGLYFVRAHYSDDFALPNSDYGPLYLSMPKPVGES